MSDSALDRVVQVTARGLEARDGPLHERELEEELVAALAAEDSFGAPKRQHSLSLAGWEGKLGHVDIALLASSPVLIEAKWGAEELAACSWDCVKLAAAISEGAGGLGLMIAGAPSEAWEMRKPGAEFFDAERRLELEGLLRRYERWFAFWREDVANYPRDLPRALETRAAASAEVRVGDEDWVIKAAWVSPTGDPTRIAYVPTAASWRGTAKPSRVRTRPMPPADDVVVGSYESLADAEAAVGPLLAAGAGEGFTAHLAGSRQLVLDSGTFRSFVEADDLPERLVSVRRFVSPADRRRFLKAVGVLRSEEGADGLLIRSGSGMGTETTLIWHGDQMQYEISGDLKRSPRELRFRPSERQWLTFWRECDRLNLWEWEPTYQPQHLSTDGYGWTVRISRGGRSAESDGYMAYPTREGSSENRTAVFSDFLAAATDLAGGRLLV